MDRLLLLHQSKRVHQVRDLLRVVTGKTGRLTPFHAGGLIGLSIIDRPAAMVLANVEANEDHGDGQCHATAYGRGWPFGNMPNGLGAITSPLTFAAALSCG